MNRKLFFQTSLISIGLVSFTAGVIISSCDNKIINVITCLMPGIVVFLFCTLYDFIQDKKTEQEKVLLGSTLTGVTEDGSYTLNPADIYDAIEKLGYIEHEWKG